MFYNNNRKIVLVGAGMVGMSFAYAALNQALCDEFVIIDIDKKRAEGEAMDLNHGVAFASGTMKIYAGEYPDCKDADIVVLCAGVNQKPGESRLELLNRNTEVFKSIIQPVMRSGFNGIFLVATNPVDIMTRVAYDLSGFNSARVFGSGTTLDTARLRYLLGEYFTVDPRNIHAYVIGEHGDSEFVPWRQAMIGTKNVVDICNQSNGQFCLEGMENLSNDVRHAAQHIIAAKNATYYGIGMALVRIAKAVLSNENSVLTVSAWLRGEYGEKNVYAGVPCIVNRNGIDRILELNLTEDEQAKFAESCAILRKNYGED
jgi:L-lactate dehydrogenase